MAPIELGRGASPHFVDIKIPQPLNSSRYKDGTNVTKGFDHIIRNISLLHKIALLIRKILGKTRKSKVW